MDILIVFNYKHSYFFFFCVIKIFLLVSGYFYHETIYTDLLYDGKE